MIGKACRGRVLSDCYTVSHVLWQVPGVASWEDNWPVFITERPMITSPLSLSRRFMLEARECPMAGRGETRELTLPFTFKPYIHNRGVAACFKG